MIDKGNTTTLPYPDPRNDQEVFTFVVTNLLQQNEKSVSCMGMCLYRCYKEDGRVLKCAAGWLIPDEDYTPEFDSQDGDVTFVEGSLNNRATNYFRAKGFNLDLLFYLQSTHDRFNVKDWKNEFAILAKEFGLVFCIK